MSQGSRPESASRPPKGSFAIPLSERLTWRLADIEAATGLSRRTLERLRSTGGLPPPDKMCGTIPLWLPRSIIRWVEGGGKP
jgi:hypothetical protein